MNKLKILILLPLMLLAALYAPTTVPSARGALVGTVCIVPAGTTGCLPSAADINDASLAVGSSITLAVNIAASDSFGGASISVFTDTAFLNPTSISDTGTAVPGTLLTLIDCVNGVPQAGAGCNSYDGLGVASLGIASLGQLTVPPTTGLLFTVTYTLVAKPAAGFSTSINYLVNVANCTGQSVAGTNDCLLMSAGAAVVPEFALGATLSTPLTDPILSGVHEAAHHLSLTKAGACACQTFTATVTNTNNGPIFVQLRVVATNGIAGFTALSTITSVGPGGIVSITFQSPSLTSFVGTKFHWTMFLDYGVSTSLGHTSASTHSGAFAVVA